jgi:hypothetical protein
MLTNTKNLLKTSLFGLLITIVFISNVDPLSKNTSPSFQEVLRKVGEIKTYHVVLNTKIFPLRLDREQQKIQENQNNKRHTINTSTVFGVSYEKLRVNSQVNMIEFNTKVDILMVFDGTWQWVEKKISKYENSKIISQQISAVKIDIATTAKDLENDPFNTSYGISGIGLFRHKDLPGTLNTLLSRYEFDDLTQEIKGLKNQELFIGKLKDYKNNEQLKAGSSEDNIKNKKDMSEIEKKNTQICKIWVGKNDRLIHGFSLGADIDDPSIYTEIEYKAINQTLPKNVFLYNPPDGIQVRDLTKHILEIRRKNEKPETK